MTAPRGVWVWRQEPDKREWSLLDGRGRVRATVWDNGTWHTWDEDGVGGENGVCEFRDDARDQVVAAIVRQEWTTVKMDWKNAPNKYK